MPRIFASLAIAECILLAGTGVIGIFANSIGTGRHIVLAVFTLILSCLIQVLAFTYLTVTGKVIVQAVHLGDLSMEKIDQAKKLKRSWTLFLAIIIFLVVLVTASGSQWFHQGEWHLVHVVSAIALFVAHVVVFYLEYDVIFRNAILMSQTLESYTHRNLGDTSSSPGSSSEVSTKSSPSTPPAS